MKIFFIFIATTLLATLQVRAQLPIGGTNIDVNNIDAHISSSVDLFWDQVNPGFEVPKGSGKHAIFAGSIWMGGLDAGSQLHVSGQTYSQTGIYVAPGPIDTAAGVATNYLQWDKCWKVTAADIQDHIQNYNTPNYIVPTSIAEWPGYDSSLNRILAPFADYNLNGIYDPQNGDYPYIPGDMAVYSIFNDMYPSSPCNQLGVEVHRTTWGFDAPGNTDLNNTIFMRYEIKNFSNENYTDFRLSNWIDFDLGDASDDYVGTDIGLDMIYVYNGDTDDLIYGTNPPAVGVYFLNQQLTTSMAYENVNGNPAGNPSGCTDYMNFLNSIWLDNQPVSYGGDGRNPGNPITTYMYPGTTDTMYYPTLGEWSEQGAGNPPNDRRMIGGIGPFTFNSQDVITVDVGYTYARATSGGPLASLAELQNAVSNLRVMYNNGNLTGLPSAPSIGEVTVYPNPATDHINISNKSGTKMSVKIFDATGRIVYRFSGATDRHHRVNTSEFSTGLYFLTVDQDNKRSVQKIMIR